MSASTYDVAPPAWSPAHRQTSRQLLVAWQNPATRSISAVGVLDAEAGTYRFRYLRNAAHADGFHAFLSFPSLDKEYHSDELFPFFLQRAMHPRRPDYQRYLDSMSLPHDASPWEQIIRSGGQRSGDTVQLFPIPRVEEDGSTECVFLVHGVRYRENTPGYWETLKSLRDGDHLDLRKEPSNPANSRALLVCATTGVELGYVPDMLLDYVHALQSDGDTSVVVEHVDSNAKNAHFRLLARVSGSVPEGFTPFSGTGWELAAPR